jgi:hypothetical protein
MPWAPQLPQSHLEYQHPCCINKTKEYSYHCPGHHSIVELTQMIRILHQAIYTAPESCSQRAQWSPYPEMSTFQMVVPSWPDNAVKTLPLRSRRSLILSLSMSTCKPDTRTQSESDIQRDAGWRLDQSSSRVWRLHSKMNQEQTLMKLLQDYREDPTLPFMGSSSKTKTKRTRINAVRTLWVSLTMCQTVNFIIDSNDKLTILGIDKYI